ncbi:LysR family transcriptional regulator, partial [Actinoplanes philippinensis]
MQLDLNLLTVLDALLQEGSVAGAAQRLRLSSPAVSRSLGRLRRLTGDDILVRTGRTMT